MNAAELIQHHEEAEVRGGREGCSYLFCTQEAGGYFIVNGNEKVIRMLIMQRRNYVRLACVHTHTHTHAATCYSKAIMEEQRATLH